jgi:hypothetical protein
MPAPPDEHQVEEELERRNRGLGLLFADDWMAYLHVHILLSSGAASIDMRFSGRL